MHSLPDCLLNRQLVFWKVGHDKALLSAHRTLLGARNTVHVPKQNATTKVTIPASCSADDSVHSWINGTTTFALASSSLPVALSAPTQTLVDLIARTSPSPAGTPDHPTFSSSLKTW